MPNVVTSKTEIVNQALDALGELPISDFNQANSKAAGLARRRGAGPEPGGSVAEPTASASRALGGARPKGERSAPVGGGAAPGVAERVHLGDERPVGTARVVGREDVVGLVARKSANNPKRLAIR